MPVLRQHHTRDFTVIPNALLQDPRLSFRDIGLLVWMLSKPDDWKFTKKNILAEIKQDGDRSLQTSINNLKAAGYLTITREDRKNGKLAESIWTVSDTPQLQNAVMAQSRSGKPVCASPRVQNEPVVTGRKEQPQSGQPQLRFPSVQNAVDYKINNNKKKKAVPAVEGGAQLSKDFYTDPETGEWRRKEKA